MRCFQMIRCQCPCEPLGVDIMKLRSVDWVVLLAIKQLGDELPSTYCEIVTVLGLKCPWRRVERLYKIGLLPSFVREEFRKLMFREDTPIRWNMVAMLYKVYCSEYGRWPEGNGPLFTQLWIDYLNKVRKPVSPGGV